MTPCIFLCTHESMILSCKPHVFVLVHMRSCICACSTSPSQESNWRCRFLSCSWLCFTFPHLRSVYRQPTVKKCFFFPAVCLVFQVFVLFYNIQSLLDSTTTIFDDSFSLRSADRRVRTTNLVEPCSFQIFFAPTLLG